MAKGKKYDHTPVESIRHADKRANIPTEELRDFVAEEERSPKYIVYPRDTSLDPQLVWKGKDEQDSKDLEIPAVPIYVQEKIHPQALIENLRQTAKAGEPEPELTLFDDYDGIEFEELIDFYQHEQNWANRMILGDSLLVMNSLAEKEGLKGQVQMIYMDPPYGIKFGSNWQVSTRKREVSDGKPDDVTRQPEQVKAFRDTWEMGIHSYLSYLRDRLVTSRELLSESGSIFVQIGEDNVHLVRSVLDEVFGADNHVSTVYFATTGGLATKTLSRIGDYLVWYAKDSLCLKYRPLWRKKSATERGDAAYKYIELEDGTRRPMTREEREGEAPLPEGGRVFRLGDLGGQGAPKTPTPFEFEGETFFPAANSHWKASYPVGMQRLRDARRIVRTGKTLNYVRYVDDNPVNPMSNAWLDTGIAGFSSDKRFVVETNTKVVERCILMTTDPGDLVLDPTCGSGTTAYCAERWGRRWVTLDTSRVALTLARTRLMSGKFPYFLLADTREGASKEGELSGVLQTRSSYGGDIRHGFVYARVPHVKMSAIAASADIGPDMSPRQIQSAIARSAEAKLLFDKPYEDSTRLRVAGPFTVESLSPHRMLDTAEVITRDRQSDECSDFTSMILANLKKAGVQNTRLEERLNFTMLEPFAGEWINGVGEYADADGKTHRVALTIGPEHGTVGSEQVKEAAKEAMRGVGFDLLVVLGFAFDSHAGETASEISPAPTENTEFAAAEASKTYGRLRVLLARMNPDLAMGDELLKKTGVGNLFMVFGEPDVELVQSGDTVRVELHGVDVYDPTTGQIRSNSTDDVACWFLDTNYNGESFFVRDAYFTGADAPYDKFKKALRADIDEAAWATIYSTVSRPFGKPSTGKIAIKVINHYGDEVMKVYDV